MWPALLLALAGEPPIVQERADVLEVNTVYCGDNGNVAFTQLIIWEAQWPDARLQVRDWRLMKTPALYPCRVRGQWQTVLSSSEELIILRAPSMRETWTPFDPELQARDELPDGQRHKLRRD